jgi:teichuronic acid biosynthesis glycosyltransferase TuaH
MSLHSFLVLSANTPWTLALADSLTENAAAVTAMRFYDWWNYLRIRPEWPTASPNLRRVMRILPPGYAGSFEPFLRPLTTALIESERRALRRRSGAEPFLICPYPYLAPWVSNVPNDQLIYYNLDEYSFYNPSRAAMIRALEDQLVSRARAVVCLSIHQVIALRNRHPTRAEKIAHLPLGVASNFLNPEPAVPPVPDTVGYIGNLTDRVDWSLVIAVAKLIPEVQFVFHGDLSAPSVERGNLEWRAAREHAFSLANVICKGKLSQADVARYYWRYSINWMPYDKTSGFNRAACPTKIMDSLASGRPFVSVDLPECRLYPKHVHIIEGAEETASCIIALLKGCQSHDSQEQIAFAATQTWSQRAKTLCNLLTA